MSYWEDVKAIRLANLIAYWRLNESGGTAVEDSGNNNYDAVANGVTWGQTGIGDGDTAPLFGTGDYVNVYSAGLSGAFNGAAGTLMCWLQVSSAGVWSDGAYRYMVELYSNSSNEIYIHKMAITNMVAFYYKAGGASNTIANFITTPDAAWHCVALTWDKAANQVKAFWDGAQFGTTQTGLGTWSGSGFSSSKCTVGADNTSGHNVWNGCLAHVVLWNAALTPAEIESLASLPEEIEWVTPITDRTLVDVTARAAKAFLNVADWERINGNTTFVKQQIFDLLGVDVTLTTLTPPTTTSFPAVGDINHLVENIDLLRVAACLPAATGIVELEHNYLPGIAAAAPDYQAVNLWEKDLDLLHTLLPVAAGYFVRCGVAATGQPRFWQVRFR
jgi:hypothetical protein